MKSVEQYIEAYRSMVQSEVGDEQVLAVGVLGLPGSMKGTLVGAASPLAGWLMRRKGKKKAPVFTMNCLMAVTPTRLISYDFRPRGTKLRIKKQLAEWQRSQVRVELGDKGLQQQLMFRLADGSTFELDGRRSFGQYDKMNDPFYQALGATEVAAQ